jgi:transposase
MGKFTTEDKIQITLRYVEGNESIEKIAGEVKVSPPILSGWVRLYEQHGIEAFIKSYTNYSVEFKLNVLNYMNETGTSSYDTAAIFNISSPGMIRNWRKAFETGGVDALQLMKKGRPSMKKVSKLNKEQQPPVEGSIEALRAENERLRMENAYLKKLNALVLEQEKLQTKSKRK